MSLKLLYRQVFAAFFLLTISFTLILDVYRGRNVIEDFSTNLIIGFCYGIFGIIVNFLLNMIFKEDKKLTKGNI